MGLPVWFWSLRAASHQTITYQKARELQLQLLESRIKDEIPDTILFLEHHPVITRGRGLQFSGVEREKHMPLPMHLPSGLDFSETERGGDLTYHGPGQLVIYPIVKLNGKGIGPYHDISLFLRKLETWMIQVLKEYQLDGSTRQNATGVWVGSKKIASIGIAVRKWVTFHGAALNCVNDLKPFFLISPCGFRPEVMTRLADWIPELEQTSWRSELEIKFARQVIKELGEEASPIIERKVLDLNYPRNLLSEVHLSGSA